MEDASVGITERGDCGDCDDVTSYLYNEDEDDDVASYDDDDDVTSTSPPYDDGTRGDETVAKVIGGCSTNFLRPTTNGSNAISLFDGTSEEEKRSDPPPWTTFCRRLFNA